MWRLAVRSVSLVLALAVALTLNLSVSSAAPSGSVDQLIGAHVAGAPTSWSAIHAFRAPCKKGTPLTCPPALMRAVVTEDGGANFGSVEFYEFASIAAAKDYYRHPGPNLRQTWRSCAPWRVQIQQATRLVGSTSSSASTWEVRTVRMGSRSALRRRS